MNLLPGSVNVCPEHVRLSMDIRHPSTSTMLQISDAIRAEAGQIAVEQSEKGCSLTWTVDSTVPATVFHDDCVDAIREAAIDVVGEDKVSDVVSGAGHDRCAIILTSRNFTPVTSVCLAVLYRNDVLHPWCLCPRKMAYPITLANTPHHKIGKLKRYMQMFDALFTHAYFVTNSAIGAQVLTTAALLFDSRRSQ